MVAIHLLLHEIKGDLAVMGTRARIQVAQYVKRYQDVYRVEWVPDTTLREGANDGPAAVCWEDWLDSLSCPHLWICQLTLLAGAKQRGVKLVHFRTGSEEVWSNPIIVGQPRKKELPVVLGFAVVLVPTKRKESIPPEWIAQEFSTQSLVSMLCVGRENILKKSGCLPDRLIVRLFSVRSRRVVKSNSKKGSHASQ